MGYEYKLIVKLSEKQKAAILSILEYLSTFNKQYYYGNKQTFDFRDSQNVGELPNFTIIFEDDGMFLCRYDSPSIWKDLDKLKNFIKSEVLCVEIIDISD